MQTVVKTINEFIDEAVEQLPGLRRRIVKRAFARNPQEKQDVADRLMLAMSENPEIKAMGLATGFVSGAFKADTPFAIDLDNLERFLQIVVEYLPKILEIVLKFLPLFVSVLILIIGCSPQPVLAETAAEAYLAAESTVCESPLQLHCNQCGQPNCSGHKRATIFVKKIPKGVLAQFGFARKQTPTLAADCPDGVSCPVPAERRSVSIVEQPTVVRQATYGPILASAPVQRQWFNHDGLSVRQHSELVHVHNTAGLSTAQVIALNDHDHNSWGGGHHPVARATGAVVRGAGGVVRNTASVTIRTAAAPVAWVRRQQPVRSAVRGITQVQPIRSVGRRVVGRAAGVVQAIRPRNIVGRVRARSCR